MPTIRANGLDIGYELAGSGPPLILLHGATSSGRDNFAAQILSLGTLFTVHAPDARGHATTGWDPAAGFLAEWLVDDLAAFLDALEIDSAHLLGFSMGAMTALTFAVRHPGRVRSLVVAGLSPLREPRASVARRLMDPDRIDRADPAWAGALARRHDPGQGAGAWRGLLRAIAADVAIQPLLSPAELHSIAVPALVACGDADPFSPVDHAWGLARQLRNGHLLVVPDCGHDLMTRRPRLVNETLLGFYRSMPSLGSEPAARAAP